MTGMETSKESKEVNKSNTASKEVNSNKVKASDEIDNKAINILQPPFKGANDSNNIEAPKEKRSIFARIADFFNNNLQHLLHPNINTSNENKDKEAEKIERNWRKNRVQWARELDLLLFVNNDLRNNVYVKNVMRDIDTNHPEKLTIYDGFRVYDAIEGVSARSNSNMESRRYYSEWTLERIISNSMGQSLEKQVEARESIWHRHLLADFNEKRDELITWKKYALFSGMHKEAIYNSEHFEEIAAKKGITEKDWNELLLMLNKIAKKGEKVLGAPMESAILLRREKPLTVPMEEYKTLLRKDEQPQPSATDTEKQAANPKAEAEKQQE